MAMVVRSVFSLASPGLFFLIIPPITFVLSLIVSFFLLTRRFVNQLISLADGLDVISEGNLSYRVPVTRKDELGKVASNINVMAERLQQQIERERKIETSKMELITGVSHDLRTPLTSIIGYLDLLRTHSYQDQEEHDRFVHNTYSKAIHLKTMIDDLFEYTRFTSHAIQLKQSRIDLHQLLDQLLFEIEPIAQENELQIDKEIGNAPVFASIDSEKFTRAIDNLLMNAIKYSMKPGAIRVVLQTDVHHCIVTIENKGRSLTKEQEQRIFERFYKVDDSRTNEGIQAGAGLGLSIAKNIIELHGGSIQLNHTNGTYAFTVMIPS